jgi:hypothetical protein
MVRTLVGAVMAAVLGALVGAGSLALAYRHVPGVVLPFGQPLPQVLTGFYGLERSGELTFAWTGPQATVNLPGLDRQVPWRCTIRLRGGRAADVTQPTVAVDIDGVPGVKGLATNLFEDVVIDVPTRPARDGLTVTIASAPTFVPGPNDKRELGVQVDHVFCAPADGVALPPRQALVAAATAAASFAVAFLVLGAPWWLALVAASVVGGAQALAVATGAALYTRYLDRLPWFAVLTSWSAVLLVGSIAWRAGRSPMPATRFVVAYSSVALYLLLLALLHPSKAVVDALFHAHRLEWVHSGRYLFTQPMPDGVAFPYAIALYVVSLPWMALTRDHVTLLRVVVCTAHILAGLLLYVAIVRRLRDPLAGALAVVLWSLVPTWFLVVGNANLTSAFGQSAATATLLSATIWPLGPRDYYQGVGLFAIAALAQLSHVGTFPQLLGAMLALAVAYRVVGGAELRAPGLWIGGMALAAAVFSVLIYYGHFGQVYGALGKVSGRGTTVNGRGPEAVVPVPGLVRRGGPTPSTAVRAVTGADVGLEAVGWPLVSLALIGAVRLASIESRNRLTLVVLALSAASAAFLAGAMLMPVEDRFYKYNVEFIGRVFFAGYPAVVILAAAGAAWCWRAGRLGQTASALLVTAAVWVGARSWWNWIG